MNSQYFSPIRLGTANAQIKYLYFVSWSSDCVQNVLFISDRLTVAGNSGAV